jgi:hypothetical protein
MQTLRDMSDQLREQARIRGRRTRTAVDDKPQIIAAVTDDLLKRGVHAGEIVKRWPASSAAAVAASPPWPRPAAATCPNCRRRSPSVPDLVASN